MFRDLCTLNFRHTKIEDEIKKLKNVAHQRYDALKRINNGRDAYDGTVWLSENKHHFQVKVATN